MTEATEARLLTRLDVAQKLNIHPKTLKGWLKEKRLEGFPMPVELVEGVHRYVGAEIDEWIALRRRVDPTTDEESQEPALQ